MAVVKKKRTRIKNRDQSRDYVNGQELHRNLVAWYASNEEEIPKIVVTAIIQIIRRLGSSGNFAGYSYLDDMKGDATIACINALNKKKYNINVEVPNPFAYFSQIAWNAFINVINIEAEQRYFKYKSLRNHNHDARVAGQTFTESSQADMDTSFVDDFEGKKKEKKKKQKQKQKEKEMSNFEVNNEK